MSLDNLIVKEDIAQKIHTFRNTKVMVDSDLAKLYGVPTGRLNEAVKRNIDRFPEDFMFQLSDKEKKELIANCDNPKNILVSPKPPFAFTEQGVAMLSGVLKSERAVQVNIYIMRAFVSMRKFMHENAGLVVRVDSLERKQIENNKNFKIIFSAMDDKVIFKRQKLFYDGQNFDAYKFVNDILKTAKKSVILIDNYIDESVFILFSELNVKVTIYTENITEKLKLDLEKYNQQYPGF